MDWYTLTAVNMEDSVHFARFDADRDVLRFPTGSLPDLLDDWTDHIAFDLSGDPIVVSIRRADCGLGCRCAGEYRVKEVL